MIEESAEAHGAQRTPVLACSSGVIKNHSDYHGKQEEKTDTIVLPHERERESGAHTSRQVNTCVYC